MDIAKFILWKSKEIERKYKNFKSYNVFRTHYNDGKLEFFVAYDVKNEIITIISDDLLFNGKTFKFNDFEKEMGEFVHLEFRNI